MKATPAVMLVLVVCAGFAGAQTVTLESNLEGDANAALFHQQDGAFIFAQFCESDWWQAYAGATYSPIPNTQVALGIGAEANGIRYGGWLWAGRGRISAIHLFEDGASGSWHKTIVQAQACDRLSLGVTDRAFYGRGIHSEYKLGDDSKITIEVFEGGDATFSLSQSF